MNQQHKLQWLNCEKLVENNQNKEVIMEFKNMKGNENEG
jgi:hypothetical protein